MTITKAERKGNPALIGLWGPSGCGKTYSALLMARGLVGPEGKIGMIDTENKRGEFYAELAGGWDHLDFQPPFDPDRYISTMKEFEEAGEYGCLIIDSQSHCWAGEGGVLDQADKNPNKGAQTWKKPKMAYGRMLNYLLRAPFHVIFCLRAKEDYNWNAKQPEMLGLAPICGKGFIYEMTVSILLGQDHMPMFKGDLVHPEIPSIKAPEALFGTIKPGEFLGEENGKAIAQWVAGAANVDKDLEKLKREARDIATFGTKRMAEFWKGLGSDKQHRLASILGELKSIAANADEPIEETDADETGTEEETPFEKPQPAQSEETGIIT